jgi:hypothetical protein
MRGKYTGSTRRKLVATVTASDAYEAMKNRIPVMKAWEQTEAERGETLAYTLFDGTRLARCRNGRVRTDRPEAIPLLLPISWTKRRIHDHVERTIDVTGTCRLSKTDADVFLKTGGLPGTGRGRLYSELEGELADCIDVHRERRARHARQHYGIYGITSRRAAMAHVIERFEGHQDRTLQARVGHHMVGSRRGVLGIHRQIVHVLWRRVLDRDIALATLRAYGRKCTLADYNRTAHYWHVRCGPDGTRDRGISTLRHTHRAAFILRSAVFPQKGGPNIVEAIQSVPTRLREVTGDGRLWRAAMTWSDPQLEPLARIVGRMAGRLERHVEEIDPDLGRLLVTRLTERSGWSPMIIQHMSWMSTDHLARLTPFLPALHAGMTTARRQRRLRPFMASVHLVIDMLVSIHEEDHAALERDARNATWARLDERQRTWHREMIAIRRLEDEADGARPHAWSPDDAWHPLLGAYSDEVGNAVEIVDARGLDQEALELDHCVDSYAPDCISGMSRIFSLRTAEHRSTLELRRRSGVWHVQQNFGKENDLPPKALTMLGRSVAKAANQAERRAARP